MKPRSVNPIPTVNLGSQLRKAILDSGLTRNRISELSGVRYAGLWRFMADERVDLTLSSASKILTALGLGIEFKPISQGKKK
ncbi:MAG: hypothetical protein AABZ47_15450 [Planctomycetota bacterium]